MIRWDSHSVWYARANVVWVSWVLYSVHDFANSLVLVLPSSLLILVLNVVQTSEQTIIILECIFLLFSFSLGCYVSLGKETMIWFERRQQEQNPVFIWLAARRLRCNSQVYRGLSISSNSEKFFHQNLLCWRVITLPNPNICISRALNDFLTYSTEPIIVTYLGLELGKKERVAHEHLVEMTARHYVVLTFHGVDALICFILINNYNQLSFSATPFRAMRAPTSVAGPA